MLRTSAGARKRAAQFHAAATLHPNRVPPAGYINGNGFGRDGFPLLLHPNQARSAKGVLQPQTSNNRNRNHPPSKGETPTDDSSQASSQDAPTISSASTSLNSTNKQKSNGKSAASASRSSATGPSTSSSNQKSNLSRQPNPETPNETPPPNKRYAPNPTERARIKAAMVKATSNQKPLRRRGGAGDESGVVRPSSDEDEGDDDDNPTNGRSAKYNGRGGRIIDVSGSESEGSESEEEAPAPKRARTVAAAWKRKVFLSTGLYSQEFKSNGAADSSSVSANSTPMPEKQKEVFPLPLHFGMNLLTDEQPFRLPEHFFEVAEDTRAKLEAQKFKKPPAYTFIRTNQYTSRPKLPGEVPVCFCDPDDNCGENCMNRLMQFICNPKHCPCGDKCTNGSLGKRPTAKLDVKHYGARGFGLKTLEPLKKDQFITEYRGEVINQDEAARRVAEYYHKTGRYYLLDYDAAAGEVLDAGLKGNMTRFANHSCQPNCFVERWLLCGTDEICTAEFQIGLFALRDIEAGEELTYDYGWSAFGPKQAAGETGENACHCGAPNCCGELGGKKAAGPIAPAPLPSRPAKTGGELPAVSSSKKILPNRDRNGKLRGTRQARSARSAPMVKGRVVKQRYKAAMAAKAAAPKKRRRSNKAASSSKVALPSSDDDEKDTDNEDKPKRPPRKTARDSIFGGGTYSRDSFAPELPSVLASNGMTMRAARRVRNAWLARIRRLKKRGVSHSDAIMEASRRAGYSKDRCADRNEVMTAERIVSSLNKQANGGKRGASRIYVKPAKGKRGSTKTIGRPRKVQPAAAAPSSKTKSPSKAPSAAIPVKTRPSVTPSPPPSPSTRNLPKEMPQSEKSSDKGKGKAKETSIPKKSIGAANFYSNSSSAAERSRRSSRRASTKAAAPASSDEEDSDADVASDSIRKDWIRPSGTRNSTKESSTSKGQSTSTSKRHEAASTPKTQDASTSKTQLSPAISTRGSRRTIITPSKDVPVPLAATQVSTASSRPRRSSPILVPVTKEEPLLLPRKRNNEAERLAHEASLSRLSGRGGGAELASSDTGEDNSLRTRSRRNASGSAVPAPAPVTPVSSSQPTRVGGSGRRMTEAERLAHEAVNSKLPGSLSRSELTYDRVAAPLKDKIPAPAPVPSPPAAMAALEPSSPPPASSSAVPAAPTLRPRRGTLPSPAAPSPPAASALASKAPMVRPRRSAPSNYAEPDTSDSELEASSPEKPSSSAVKGPGATKRGRASMGKDKTEEPASKKARVAVASSSSSEPDEPIPSASTPVKVNGLGVAPADEDDDEVLKQLALTPEKGPPVVAKRVSARPKPRASAPAVIPAVKSKESSAVKPAAAAKPSSAAASKFAARTSNSNPIPTSTSKDLAPKASTSKDAAQASTSKDLAPGAFTPNEAARASTSRDLASAYTAISPAVSQTKAKPRASAPGAMDGGAATSPPTEPSSNGKKPTKFVYTHRVCDWCKTSFTGVWRPGPNGPATLCNACGSKWRRHRIAEGLIPDPAAKKKEK